MKVAQWFLLLILVFSWFPFAWFHFNVKGSQRRIWLIFNTTVQTPYPAISGPEMLLVEENFMEGAALKCGCHLQRCKRLNTGLWTHEKRELQPREIHRADQRPEDKGLEGTKSTSSKHGGIWKKDVGEKKRRWDEAITLNKEKTCHLGSTK